MRLGTFPILVILVLAVPSRAATIRVPTDQPTIQAGINAANAGDSVVVAPGTYTGAGNKNLNLKGKPLVLRSEDGAAVTIIDCEGQGRGFYFQAGETPSTVVEGFTIRNGAVSGLFPDGWGGGILCVGSSPTITDCAIRACSASPSGDVHGGGGVACYDYAPLFRN